MSKRILVVVIAATAFLATSLVGVAASGGFWGDGYRHHRKNIPVNWRVSGTVASVVFYLPDTTPPFYELQPGILVNAVTTGTPGNAQFTVVGWTAPEPPDECGAFDQFMSLRNDFVATFADQSMLFATLDPDLGGYVCNGPLPSVFNMIITGGTGRFEGAGGHFQGKFDGYPIGPPVNLLPGALLGETGTIEGEIVWDSSVP
jgi:hypothetical protein